MWIYVAFFSFSCACVWKRGAAAAGERHTEEIRMMACRIITKLWTMGPGPYTAAERERALNADILACIEERDWIILQNGMCRQGGTKVRGQQFCAL